LATNRLDYQEVRDLVDRYGGKMEWNSGGAGGGGTSSVRLEDRELKVPIPRYPGDHRNQLEDLYNGTKTHTLRPDAFWLLIEAFIPNRS
jgi:hypothetical protein